MKKLVTGVVLAVISAVGLYGAAEVPATAADPYPHTVKTFTRVHVPVQVRVGKRYHVNAFVDTNGSAAPTGNVVMTVRRYGGGYFYQVKRAYSGKRIKFFPGKAIPMRGTYKVSVKFTPNRHTVYLKSGDTDSMGTPTKA